MVKHALRGQSPLVKVGPLWSLRDDVVLTDLGPALKFVQSKLDCAALGGLHLRMIKAATASY
jgi:hypothetical protein